MRQMSAEFKNYFSRGNSCHYLVTTKQGQDVLSIYAQLNSIHGLFLLSLVINDLSYKTGKISEFLTVICKSLSCKKLESDVAEKT